MAVEFYAEQLGKMVVKHKDQEFNVEIRRGNCLAVFITDNGEYYSLFMFFADEKHLKNLVKDFNGDLFGYEVVSIELNTRYKESMTMLKYLPKCGYKVTCYYE